jgi:hypothetical protein
MPDHLLELDTAALTQRLIEAVRGARRMAQEGDDVALHELLETVRSAADVAKGTQYELLQLAEAALRTAARTDLGRTELAMREFFTKHPSDADEIFSVLLQPAPVPPGRVDRRGPDVRSDLEKLVQVGVLSNGPEGLVLRAAHRALARELHEPTVLRMWRLVDECLKQIKVSRLDEDGSSGLLSARLGISEPQARRFVAREGAHGAGIPYVSSAVVPQPLIMGTTYSRLGSTSDREWLWVFGSRSHVPATQQQISLGNSRVTGLVDATTTMRIVANGLLNVEAPNVNAASYVRPVDELAPDSGP